MTITNLRSAIKPQFAWIEDPFKKPKTAEKSERYQGFGPMVFIGIAYYLDIPKSEVLDYLEIKNPEYNHKLEDFKCYFEMIKVRKEEGTLCRHSDFVDRVYLKTRLTLNALNTQLPGEIIQCTLYI